MPDFKLVGAVAIKVRPDTTDFKRDTQRGVDKELAGYDADVEVTAKVKLDGAKAKTDAKKLEKDLEGKEITWEVKLDHDSARAAQKQFERLLQPTQTITFDLDDEGSIEKARADLAKMAKEAEVKMTYVQDEKGYQSVLDRIAALRREKLELPLDIQMDEAEWDRIEKEMNEKLSEFVAPPITQVLHLDVREDRDSLTAAIAAIDAELKKLYVNDFPVELDQKSLWDARYELEKRLSDAPLIIKYTQDEQGYKGVLAKIKELQRQRVEIPFDINLSDAELEAQVQKIEKKIEKLEKKELILKVGLDTMSVLKAQRQLDEAVKRVGDMTIRIDLKDEGSIDAARDQMDQLMDDSKIEIEFIPDEKGYKDVLAKIKEIKRELADPEQIEFDWDEASLEAQTAAIQARLDAFEPTKTINLSYTNDRASIEKVIAQIKAEQDKIDSIKFDVELDPVELAAKRRLMEMILAGTPVIVKVNYDDQASVKAARARIQEMLNDVDSKEIKVQVDKPHLEAELAQLDARLKAFEETERVKLQVGLAAGSIVKTATALALLTKDQTINVFMRLRNSSLLLAAAKLTGLRAASRWTEAFAKSLGKLDRNLPIVAALVVGLSALSSGFLSLTADVFSLGNGLGEVLRMGGLLIPAMVLGLGAVMTVFTGVFKDFGAAVNGDEKAIKKLTASGKEAAAQIRVSFQAIRETVSANFWDKAGDAMLRFTKGTMPVLENGLGRLATSLGGVMSGVLDSFTRLTEQGGTKLFFDNLIKGFDVAQTGLASFMSGFLTLGIVGSSIFPRMGRAFEAWAGRFDAWVQRLAIDGTLNRWIDRGIQGMKDLFNAGGSIVKIWGNIGLAAQASGAVTLHSFAQMMDRIDKVTAGSRFQENMGNIFKGAREASISFHDALGKLGPAMDVFSITVKNSLSGAGTALASFIALMGDLMSSPLLDKGMSAFMSGITSMFDSLRPSAGAIATILSTFGEILGAVATDSGPLFRNLFSQIATVLTTAWHALEPFLPGLIGIGTTIINVLGPALASAAGTLIPAFAGAVQALGPGLVIVTKFLADFAVGVVQMVSGLQVPTLALMAGIILTLGGALKFAALVAPLAAAGMTVFGIEAGIAGARAQLMVPVVGILLAALAGLAIGGVAALATTMKSAAPFANEYADALDQDARAADGLADSVGKATRELTAKKLVDTGALDAAKKLGIGTQELVDAALKGGPALEAIQRRISEATAVYAENDREAQNAARGMGEFSSALGGPQGATLSMTEANDAASILRSGIDDTRGSFLAGTEQTKKYAEVNKYAGIVAEGQGEAYKSLIDRARESSTQLGAAAAASTVLQDAMSSSTAKIDAMRKTFEILVGPNAKQQAAEALGAYASGFNNLKDSVQPLAGDMKKLGDAVYGENGFLNVAGGNKAVLQVNQALVDQVNNTWAGSKAIYDEALKAGDNATVAYQKAQDFITKHKGDYDSLAKESGISAEKVQGQWDAVFGKEWVLKVALSGATEAAAIAQAMVTVLGGTFDGQTFTAMMNADPTMAMLAIKDPVAAAEYFVNREWIAQIDALPGPARDKIKGLIEETGNTWDRGNFEATMKVAAGVPGLQKALQDIRNGVGVPYYANIFAQMNNASLIGVQIALNSLTYTRTVAIRVAYDYANAGDPMARGGQRQIGSANGNILNGRGIKQFANGGIERHIAQITKPGSPIRVWSEAETQGEAYVPYAMSKRPRSVAILSQVAKDFGYQLTKADHFSNGGTVGTAASSTNNTASVTIGNLYTTDADEAVRKIRTSQLDALAVAGISLNGA